jgi:hypothetical protein
LQQNDKVKTMQVSRLPAAKHIKDAGPRQTNAPAVEEGGKGLRPEARFLLFKAVDLAVLSIASGEAQKVRLSAAVLNGSPIHIWLFPQDSKCGTHDLPVIVAHSNDMCLFTGGPPSLYVKQHAGGELENSIYLYLAEHLSGQKVITVQIFREGKNEMPVLEGRSDEGSGNLSPKSHAIVL